MRKHAKAHLFVPLCATHLMENHACHQDVTKRSKRADPRPAHKQD